MIKASALLVLALIALFAAHTSAEAGCACTCVDGNMVAACPNPYDVPPICSLRTCAPPMVRPIVPLLNTHACVDTETCDQFGNCEWNPVCN